MNMVEEMESNEDDNELGDALNRVNDRESFLNFVRALVKDKEEETVQEAATPRAPFK